MNDLSADVSSSVRRHLSLGWWLILVFLTLGISLEFLHGFKSSYLLDVSNETRRLLWRLAHAHGVLLGMLHLGFAATLVALPGMRLRRRALASRCLTGASLLLPGGFFLGGIVVYEADPWIGILLVPLGALLLFVGVLSFALDLSRSGPLQD